MLTEFEAATVGRKKVSLLLSLPSSISGLGLYEIIAALPVSFSPSPECADYDLIFVPFPGGQDPANVEFRKTGNNNICGGKRQERMPCEFLQSNRIPQEKTNRLYLQWGPKHCGEWSGGGGRSGKWAKITNQEVMVGILNVVFRGQISWSQICLSHSYLMKKTFFPKWDLFLSELLAISLLSIKSLSPPL